VEALRQAAQSGVDGADEVSDRVNLVKNDDAVCAEAVGSLGAASACIPWGLRSRLRPDAASLAPRIEVITHVNITDSLPSVRFNPHRERLGCTANAQQMTGLSGAVRPERDMALGVLRPLGSDGACQ
jgi:hypothetical protein